MERDEAISRLLAYAERRGLIEADERVWAANRVLGALGLAGWEDPGLSWATDDLALAPILDALLDDAFARGALESDSVVCRDLLDTEVMGRLTPRPAQVRERFERLYAKDPAAATDWYYAFSKDVNYIRRDRAARDVRWTVPTAYGALDITINLAKPEKDPAAIAAARSLPSSGYPRCPLCAENEGYAGRPDAQARQNLRLVPVELAGERWYLQYSPYGYYNEHCICLAPVHRPMRIDRATFERLLDFVGQFPHYFMGSNADLPIVGGSILSHDHFQGGRFEFAMERAPIEAPWAFPGLEQVEAGIVRWPMSVVRLRGAEPEALVELADRILLAWRDHTDEEAGIFAETCGEPHNTITPIARRRGADCELDLVLRNNRTTPEHPLGLFHPHEGLHHIKRENIGLIEVMGLAVLPARLKAELTALAEALVAGTDLRADERTAKHAAWAEGLAGRYDFPAMEVAEVEETLRLETGLVFEQVLEDAGVFKRTPQGQAAFLRFLRSVG